jgi:hypothetical protein
MMEKMSSSTNSNAIPTAETQCMVAATRLQIIQRRSKDGFGIGQGTWK